MKVLKMLFCLFLASFSDADLGDFERSRFEEIYRNSRNSIVGIKVVKSKMSPSVYGDVSNTEIGSGFIYDSEEGLISKFENFFKFSKSDFFSNKKFKIYYLKLHNDFDIMILMYLYIINSIFFHLFII